VGAQEVVEHQTTGLFVPIGNPSLIADAVIDLLADAERRREMGARASDAARTRFSLTRMVDEIEAIYTAGSNEAH
jgi:glycosyltransferase involved in cell wall biosynthesis